jgi:hypothetical protein
VGLPLFAGYLRLDPNHKLNGAEAIRIYRQMRYDEPSASAFINAGMHLLRTDYSVEPGGPKRADKKAAALLTRALQGMETPFERVLRQMYAIMWAGWSLHELGWTKDADGHIVFKGMYLRRQETLQRWLTDPDDAGTVLGMEQRPPPDYRLRQIPFSRAVHVTADDTEGSPEGLSSLRGMYRPWYIVRNLEMLLGIALERFGTGIPVFEVDKELKAGLTAQDQATLEAAVAGLRQNEEAGIILPAGVSFRFAESPGLRADDYLSTIQYMRIVGLSTVLADFIALGTQNGGGGAFALSKDKSELFLMTLNTYQDRVLDALNRQAVARLLAWPANDMGTLTGPPRIVLPPVKRYELDKLGDFVGLLNSLGAWTGTPSDEAHFRKISDLLDKSAEQIKEERERAAEEARERAEAMGLPAAPGKESDDPEGGPGDAAVEAERRPNQTEQTEDGMEEADDDTAD